MPKIKDLGITVVPEQFQPPEIGGGGGCGVTFCTDCTTQQFSICGTSPGPTGCTDCTTQAFSICGTTCGARSFGCVDCSTAGATFCTDCTTQAFSICGTTRGAVACRLQSRFPTNITDITTPCGGSWDPTIRQRPGGGLRLEDIAQLRAQLNEQLKALDEYEKALGPQSLEEVDAREKQLTDELSKLKSLRSELGKKK